MSILNDLVSYSSVNSRYEKSYDASNRHHTETVPRNSKSLAKLSLWDANSSQLDPKARSIHKIIHRLNTKVKKNYYTFFVNLESIKKKTKLKRSNPHFQRFLQPLSKLQQWFNLQVLKLYQNKYKSVIFSNIKRHVNKKIVFLKIIQLLKNYNKRIVYYKFISNIKQIERVFIKLEILNQSILNIQKSYQLNYHRELLRKSFNLLKINPKVLWRIEEEQLQNSIEQVKTPIKSYIINNDIKTTQQKKQFKNLRMTRFIIGKNTQWSEKIETNEKKNYFAQNHKIYGDKKKHMMDLSNMKCYKIKSKITQNPFIYQNNQEKEPKILTKIPYQICSVEIGDQFDKSEIFRQHPFPKILINFQTRYHTQQIDQKSVKLDDGIYSDKFYFEDQGSKITYQSQTKGSFINNFNHSRLPSYQYQNSQKQFQESFGRQTVNFKNLLIDKRKNIKESQISYFNTNEFTQFRRNASSNYPYLEIRNNLAYQKNSSFEKSYNNSNELSNELFRKKSYSYTVRDNWNNNSQGKSWIDLKPPLYNRNIQNITENNEKKGKGCIQMISFNKKY